MCVVSTPKIPAPSPSQQDKPPPIIRNPILDGLLGNIAATRAGTSAFRIDLVNPLTIPRPTGSGIGGGGASGGGGAGSGSTGSGSGSGSGSSLPSYTGGGGGSGFGRTGRTPSAL